MGSLIFKSPYKELGFPGGSDSKESAHNVGWSLSQGDPLEKEVATYSGILAWRIPWTEEPGRLQSTGLQRVRHNWETNTHTHAVADVSRKSHTTDLFFFFFHFILQVPWMSLSEFFQRAPLGELPVQWKLEVWKTAWKYYGKQGWGEFKIWENASSSSEISMY